MALTRRTLAAHLARKLRVKYADAYLVMNECLDAIAASLKTGRRVELRNFGVFQVRGHGGGIANAHLAGTQVSIPPHCRVAFKPSDDLRSAVLKLPLPVGFRVRKR